MAHLLAKVIVPECAVDAVPAVKVHDPWHGRQKVIDSLHVVGDELDIYPVLACRRRSLRPACRYKHTVDSIISVVGSKYLVCQIDVNPAAYAHVRS